MTKKESQAPKSYAAEVIADSSGSWCGNGLTFVSSSEAGEYAKDLASRWLAVREHRVVGKDCPATHEMKDGKAHAIKS